MSRDELVAVVARQAERLAARDRQIAEMAGKLGELMETNEALIEKLARLEHLLSRNSGNSSSPPSRDGDLGKPPVPGKIVGMAHALGLEVTAEWVETGRVTVRATGFAGRARGFCRTTASSARRRRSRTAGRGPLCAGR